MGLVPRPPFGLGRDIRQASPLKACEDFIAQLPDALSRPCDFHGEGTLEGDGEGVQPNGHSGEQADGKEALEGVEGGLLEIAPARCVLNAALKGRYHHADGKEGPAQLGEEAHH